MTMQLKKMTILLSSTLEKELMRRSSTNSKDSQQQQIDGVPLDDYWQAYLATPLLLQTPTGLFIPPANIESRL